VKKKHKGKGLQMAKRASLRKSGHSRRRAVVTGASAGIGAAFAEHLAREHYDLIIVARGRERLEALGRRLRKSEGIHVEPLAADLTDPAQLRVVEEMVADDDALELLVNNAGFGTFGRFAELAADEEEAEIRLNVVALVRLTRAALPGMLARRRGAVINVSSLAALQPAPYNATYGATKAYVNSFTEAIHEELRGTGVRVQALCPGFTRTEFQKRAGIDTRSIPSFAWMEPDAVVRASLAGLRQGEVVCVPGMGNRVVAALTGTVPRSLARRIAGSLVRPYAV
jgi:short-subunit dehydrogenase